MTTQDDTAELLRRTDSMLRGVDAMQKLMEQLLAHARELEAAKIQIADLQQDVGQLARILRDGNGASVVGQLTELRGDLRHLRERWQDATQRRWQVWLGVGLGGLALLPEVIRLIRAVAIP